jgi:hypothetical protein
MGIQVQFLLGKPDDIHGPRITFGAKAGADILLFAKLQAGCFIIMERTQCFALFIYPDIQVVGYFEDAQAGFEVLDFHIRKIFEKSFLINISIKCMTYNSFKQKIPISFDRYIFLHLDIIDQKHLL